MNPDGLRRMVALLAAAIYLAPGDASSDSIDTLVETAADLEVNYLTPKQ